jgi:outer membrane receptor protein involved in Fe transport
MIRKTAIARSVALAFGMAAVGVWVAPAAYAQSNTTGSIYGTVDSAAGAEILVESKDTGFKRTIKPDANGRFNLPSVPAGTYTVSLVRNGQVVSKQEGIEVRITQGSEVTLTATQTVQIRASRVAKIDTSSATSAAVFTSKDLERLPVAGNVGAIIQLAPNTTKGDSRYGGTNAPSFGGSSASENAYYINGFPVTNMLTQVGFSQLPFNAIGQAQVLTGGYGAEFGRSTGGVVNIITKRGGNDWEVGGSVSYEPRSLRARERDMLYEPTGAGTPPGAFNGKYRLYNGLNTDERTVASAYAGGPIIKDKLFFFGSLEETRRTRDSVRTANNSATYTISPLTQSTSFQEIEIQIPRYLVKLDWAITDNYTLEYTRIQDKVKDTRKFYGFNYATLQRTSVRNGGFSYLNWGPTAVAAQQGATVDILKATGYVTDDVTITAVVGKTKSPHEQVPAGYNAALPQIVLNGAQAPGLTYLVPQGIVGSLLTPGAYDENKGARVDVEWKINNAHKLRGGIDSNTITSKAGSATAGGSIWTYFKATNPAAVPYVGAAAPNSVTGNPLAQQGYYAENSTGLVTLSRPQVKQTAQYIEDQWQFNKDLLFVLGLRNEGFDNLNGGDENANNRKSYIKLNKQIAPRFSAIWDTKGDASSVIKTSLGRYHVPLPTNVAIRGAGSSLNARTAYTYTGVDPVTGAPTGLVQLGPLYSSNNELGQAKDPNEVASKNIKGNYQDEFAIGIEQAIAKDWKSSAKFTYRTLRTVLDDHCDDRPFRAWADRYGVDASHWGYNCALFNPGRGNNFTIDLNGDGKYENINLSAADLGVLKPKRKYIALDFGLEHPFDGKWWLKVNYTWSQNKGNAEGQLLSDIGQGDVATTQAYDFPEFSINADGKLPNNRTHQVKVFGYYQVLEQWGAGANFVYSSGRPKNCIGNAPVDTPLETPFVPGSSPVTDYAGYGSAYFFCDGKPSPRGSKGSLPPEMTLDLSLRFTPTALPGLKLQADMFNVFNRQVAEVIEERYNTGGGLRTTYGAVQSYSNPRAVKFTVSYDKKF